jgi:hypothetical protein
MSKNIKMSKMLKFQEFAMEEYRLLTLYYENGRISLQTFRENFRGIILLRGSKAEKRAQRKYKAWRKAQANLVHPSNDSTSHSEQA